MKTKKIAIIGCGNLGMAILNGLLDRGIPGTHITATRRHTQSLSILAEKGVGITTNNQEAVDNADIVIVALKPYTILEVLKKLSFDPKRHIIISLATGISIEAIAPLVNHAPLFRAMPNTGADVGKSLTCVATKNTDNDTAALVYEVFNAIGHTVIIDEELMDAATVMGACGIAFVMRFMRAMIQGGIQIGFDTKTATEIVNHTVQGAAELLITRKAHPESEIDKVTTPKGCTIAGLNEMEHNGFSSALIKGIVTSFNDIKS